MVPSITVSTVAADGLFQTLLQVSLTGVIVFRPVYTPQAPATLVDLAYVQLNPAAQRMLRLPECPGETFLSLYPNAIHTGIFAFYRDTFLAGTAGRYDVNYQHDGLDNYYQLAAQRHGEVLVVSFSDTANQPRTAVEAALRKSQAAERDARAEAQSQREELTHLFAQAPVALAVFRGPRYVVEMANPAVLRMWGRTPAQALNTPLFELLPEISGQGFEELLAGVLATGRSHVAHEMPGRIDREGRHDTAYWNFVYEPLRGAQGQVTGVTVVAVEVTEQVLARQQLQQLNQELEARVLERTQALRHAQAESVAAAQRLLRVTESLPSTTFTADQSGRVLYISPQWNAYTGMVPGADINEAWPRLIHPDDLPAITQEFNAALVEGRPWRYEFRLRGADGQYRWFASQGVPEPLAEAKEAGRPRQWFGSNLDIDDLKQAQQAQQTQEQLLTTILTSLPADVVTFEGEELRYTFFNEAFQRRMAGRAVLGRTVDELFPEASAQGHTDELRTVLRTAEPHRTSEAPVYVQDLQLGVQQEMFLDLTYLPLRHGQEPPHAVMAFAVDVTERVRARQERETQRQRLLSLFQEAPAGICILAGPHLLFEFVNPGYQRLLPGRRLQDRPIFEALPELVGTPVEALLRQVFVTGQAHEEYGLLVPLARTAHGVPEDRYFTFLYQGRRDDQGQVSGVLVFAFEVTEQVLARQQVDFLNQALAATNAELHESNTQLLRTNADLDTFVYTASHDLKAPITNIEGLLTALDEHLPAAARQAEPVPYLLGLLRGAVERFQLTIDQLTDITKLQQAQQQPAETIDLAALIEAVRLDLSPLLAATGAQITVAVVECPSIRFSPKNLRSIVYNLLSNAVKYRHPERAPLVQVRCRRDLPGTVVLEVQDNGLGLNESQQAKLFGMFQRLHTHVEGSGIGLYMVKRIIDNAGGTIVVHSQIDLGTTFTVTLPD